MSVEFDEFEIESLWSQPNEVVDEVNLALGTLLWRVPSRRVSLATFLSDSKIHLSL